MERCVRQMFLVALTGALATAGSESAPPQPAAIPQPAAVAKTTVAAAQPPTPVKFEITHFETGPPQIVHIWYLEEGTRVVLLPPAPPPERPATAESAKAPAEASQPSVVVISSDAGNRAIVLPPAP